MPVHPEEIAAVFPIALRRHRMLETHEDEFRLRRIGMSGQRDGVALVEMDRIGEALDVEPVDIGVTCESADPATQHRCGREQTALERGPTERHENEASPAQYIRRFSISRAITEMAKLAPMLCEVTRISSVRFFNASEAASAPVR